MFSPFLLSIFDVLPCRFPEAPLVGGNYSPSYCFSALAARRSGSLSVVSEPLGTNAQFISLLKKH